MEGTVLLMFLATSSIAVVFSSPIAIAHINYDNVPQCMQPSESGLCLAYIPSFYYNSAKGTCESFIYGGCKGNQNRFFSFDDCMATCGGFKPKKDATFKLRLETDSDLERELAKEIIEEVPVAEADICSQPPVMGPCRAMMPRLYFNGQDCEFFIYGGCQGNGNNFKTVEECTQTCASKSAEGSSAVETSAEETSNDKTSDVSTTEEKGEESSSVAETSAEETSDVSTEEKGESSAETDETPGASSEEPTKEETSEESSAEAKNSTEQ